MTKSKPPTGGPDYLTPELSRRIVCRCGHHEMVYGASVAELDDQERSWRLFDCMGCHIHSQIERKQIQENIAAAAAKRATAPLQ